MGNSPISNHSFLILGGLGYFGSRLADYLVKNNKVTVTCRSNNPIRNTWAESKKIDVFCTGGKRLNDNLLSRQFDIVVNLATPGSSECAKDTAKALQETQQSINDCLAGLRSGRFRTLVHFSSFHVYGKIHNSYSETDKPQPVSPYGVVHYEAEKTLCTLGTDLPISVLRPSNMVGQPAHPVLGDQARLLALDLCRQVIGGELSIHNDGKSYRDFISIENAISAAEAIFLSKFNKYKVYNLAFGKSLTISDFADILNDCCRRNQMNVKIKYGGGTDQYRLPFSIDNSRLKGLGWNPNPDLPIVISKIVEFFKGVQN